MKKVKTSIEMIRYAQRLFDMCRESFNEKFSAEDLLKIASAMNRSDWEIYPDQWEKRQLQEAIEHGIAPDWEEDPRYRGYRAKYKAIPESANYTMDSVSGKLTLNALAGYREPQVMYIAVFKDGIASLPYRSEDSLWIHNKYRENMFSEMCSSSDKGILGVLVSEAVQRANGKRS